MSSCAAVILAAGFSNRIEQFKPLLSLGGETITDRVIATFRQNDVEVYLVTGNRGDELTAGIDTRNVSIVDNPDYRQGMFSSVQAGVRSLAPGYDAFFIMPVDIPLVRPFTIRRLLVASEEHPDRIIYPAFRGMRGHPPLIPVKLAPAVEAWNEDGGLRAVLDAHESLSLEVSVADGNILLDIDTADDYRMLLDRFRCYEVPTNEECGVILTDICRVSPDIHSHSLKVTEVALSICESLIEAGQQPDLSVVRAAAMLHDIAKGQTGHAACGGRILREMGFGTIGDIVSMHTDIPEDSAGISLETRIVYLADGFVEGEVTVPIEERFDSSIRRYGATQSIIADILQRKNRALGVKAELEDLLGYRLETLIFKEFV